MSLKHEFKCDACGDAAPANWNGEHHLPPAGRLDLHDFNLVEDVWHLCNKCVPKKFRTEKKTAPKAKVKA